MEMLFIVVTTIVGFSAYWIGKFKGVNETFEHLEKEGKIIDKDELSKLTGR